VCAAVSVIQCLRAVQTVARPSLHRVAGMFIGSVVSNHCSLSNHNFRLHQMPNILTDVHSVYQSVCRQRHVQCTPRAVRTGSFGTAFAKYFGHLVYTSTIPIPGCHVCDGFSSLPQLPLAHPLPHSGCWLSASCQCYTLPSSSSHHVSKHVN